MFSPAETGKLRTALGRANRLIPQVLIFACLSLPLPAHKTDALLEINEKMLRSGPDEKQARIACRRIAKINEILGAD
jgi:hypothetical protein